jgi:NAD-dependent deacetylase
MSGFEQRVRAAERVVVFTGAGVSQESGLGTFRDVDGLWRRFSIQDLATAEAFARDPERVTSWYRERLGQAGSAVPNAAHRAIARWQELFPSLVVVTQNVDRLHQRAGSSEVLELHGSLWVWRCSVCGVEIEAGRLPDGSPVPCTCGGRLRPGVVWFGEALPNEVFHRAHFESRRADLFVAVGTSATVWPAAGLIEIAASAGALVVEANREETPFSDLADLSLRGAAGQVLPQWTRVLEEWRTET